VKVLVLRFSSIGDIVLTSPVLRCLKEQVKDIEIHFLTKKKFFSLLEHNPRISKIFTFESSLSAVVPKLKAEKYDLIIDLHNNLRSNYLKLLLGKPAFAFDKLNLRKWLLVNLKKDSMPDVHIVVRYLETVKKLGVKNDGKGLEFFPCDCEIVENSEYPTEMKGLPFAVLSIGGTHFTKKMPLEKWIELAAQVDLALVIVGGKEDFKMANSLEIELKKQGKNVWNTCGKFTVGGSAHLIKNSALVLTHDTGMMHIAAAFAIPTVTIWGNTIPKLGMYPYKTSYINLEVSDLNCRPCSKIGFSACPKSHFDCMLKQDFSQKPLQKFISQAIETSITNG
jgi:ADP-heptose:LPS heptosyltransferase